MPEHSICMIYSEILRSDSIMPTFNLIHYIILNIVKQIVQVIEVWNTNIKMNVPIVRCLLR